MQDRIKRFKCPKGYNHLRIMEKENTELNFQDPNSDKPVSTTQKVEVILNLGSREVVTIKGMNTRGGQNGLPLPKLLGGVERGDIYSVYEISVFQPGTNVKEGILYVKEEK